MARIICSYSGVPFNVDYAPMNAHAPHPALAWGMNYPAPQTMREHMLALASSLHAISAHGIIEHRGPLHIRHFSPVWINTALSQLQQFYMHIQSLGTLRRTLYPTLVIDNHTNPKAIEVWLNECSIIASDYIPLSTRARDIANEAHRVMVAALSKQTQQDSAPFKTYINQCAVDCGVDDSARVAFIRTCHNPQGSSDRNIENVLNLIHDWAPQTTVDEQLFFDMLVQRLADALLDVRKRNAAHFRNINTALSAGLFTTEEDTPKQEIKKRTDNTLSLKLAALLNQAKAI